MSASIVGLVIGGASVGLAGASAAGAFSPGAPPSVSKQSNALLAAQIAQAPAQYQSNATFNPLYAALNNTIAWNNLFGTPAGTAPKTVSQAGWYDQNGNFFSPGKKVSTGGGGFLGGFGKVLNISSMGAPGGGLVGAGLNAVAGGGGGHKYVPGKSPGSQYTWVEKGGTVKTPTAAAPGTLEMMAKAQPALLGLQTSARAQDIADVQNLGPAAYQSIRDYNPAVTGLFDTMDAQTQALLNTNGKLDLFTQQQLQQSYRSGEAARGLAGGASDAAAEAYYQTATQEQRRLANLNLAGNVAGQTAAYYGDPFQQVLARTSGGVQPGPVGYTANQPNSLDISNGAYALAGQNANLQYDNNTSRAATSLQGLSSLLSGAGSFANQLHSYFNPPTPAAGAGATSHF